MFDAPEAVHHAIIERDFNSCIFLPFFGNDNNFERNRRKILEGKRSSARIIRRAARVIRGVEAASFSQCKSRDDHKPASVKGVRARGSWVTAASLESPQAR